jgi:hypothetical protein
MAVNVAGGALEWEAVINFDDAMKQTKDFAAGIASSLKNQPVNAQLNILNEKFQQLGDQAVSLQERLSKTKDPVAIKSLNTELTSTAVQLKVVNNLIGQMSPDPVEQVNKALGVQNDQLINAYTRLRQLKSSLVALAEDKTSPEFQKTLEEATQLERHLTDVNKQLRLTSSEVSGVQALQQGFRGLIGGAEAFAGVMGLLSANEEQAAVITKNLVALMSILNGVEELGAIVAKNSALNVFLLQTFRKQAAVAALEQSAATEAVAVAETEGIAVTEAATVAQEGLNVAMAANPVGLLIGAIVALYATYEILKNTIFRTTDEKKKEKAATDALFEAQKKAADAIAGEEAEMQKLLAVAKDDTLTREQRGRAIDELRRKYPEYLSQLRLETLYTNEASHAISEQIDLIKKKAIAAAAEDLYKEKLKKVIEKQVELNKTVKEGGGFFEKLFAQFKSGNTQTGGLALLTDKMNDLKDATNEADGVLDAMNQTQHDLGVTTQTTADKIQVQIDKMQAFKVSSNSNALDGLINTMKTIKENLPLELQVFDPAKFDEERKQIELTYQAKIDRAKKGTAEEIRLQKEKVKALHDQDLKDQRIFQAQGRAGTPIDNETTIAQAKALQAKFAGDMNDLNEQLAQKAFQNATAAASSIVLALQRAGQEGSKQFFEEQRNARIAAADEEIFQAKDNAGQILEIRARLSLDLRNIDLAEQKQFLENERSITQTRINLAKEGSQQELDLRKQLIDIAAKEELLQAGDNVARIQEINSNAAKQKFDLDKKFTQEASVTDLKITEAGLETKLSLAERGSKQEFLLKKQLIEQKALLDEQDAKRQSKNEDLLQATLKEIHAKSLQEIRKLEDEFFDEQIRKQFGIIDAHTDAVNAQLQHIIDSPVSTASKKREAAKTQLENTIASLKKEQALLFSGIASGKGDAQELEAKVDELQAKIKKLQGDLANANTSADLEKLAALEKDINRVSGAFDQLSSSVADLNPGLSETFSEISSIGNIIGSVLSSFASFASGDIVGGITSAIQAIAGIFNLGKKAREEGRQHRKEVDDFLTAQFIGESEINLLYEQRVREQVKLNKLRLDGLRDEKALLLQQKNDLQKQYETVFTQLQKQSAKVIGRLSLFRNIPGDATFGQQFITESLAGKSFKELEDLFLKGQLEGKAKELFLELQKIKDAGVDVDALLTQNAESFREAITGTTAESISDSIIQGFEQGKIGASDFADDFKSLMQKAVLQSLKLKFLEGPLKDFFEEFANLSDSDGQLTQGEIDQLQQMYNTIINNASDQFDALQKVAGLNITGQNAGANSLTGAVKSITEDTANLLAGQIGGLRLTAMDQLNVSRTQLTALIGIEGNTSKMVLRLETLLAKFDNYETGVKKLYVVP